MLHTGTKVIADDQPINAAQELKQAHVTVEPGRQLLRQRGDRERIGTRTQCSHKQLRRDHRARVRIRQPQATTEVDKYLLAGPMRLA